MTDAELLVFWNRSIEARDAFMADQELVAVEIRMGRLQLRYEAYLQHLRTIGGPVTPARTGGGGFVARPERALRRRRLRRERVALHELVRNGTEAEKNPLLDHRSAVECVSLRPRRRPA